MAGAMYAGPGLITWLRWAPSGALPRRRWKGSPPGCGSSHLHRGEPVDPVSDTAITRPSESGRPGGLMVIA